MATKSTGAADAERAPTPAGGRMRVRAAERVAAERQAQRRRELFRLGMVGAAAVVLAAGLALATNLNATSTRPPEVRPYPVNGTFKGDPSAPALVTVWSDFM